MISRRDFLGASTLAAAGAALGPARTLAGQARAEAQQALPPSIARLTSRAAEAKPISVEERAARVEQAKRLMKQNGLSALYLTGGTSMVYFTGVNWGGGERLFAVTIPVDGDPFVVCPYFEEDRAREQLAMGPLKDAKVMTWLEDQSPYVLVAQGLKDTGISTGKIGCEETVQFRFSNGLALAAPASQVVSGTPVTAGCRGVKSEHEIALMQLANEVTLTAYKAAYLALEEGMTQQQFSRLIGQATSRQGFSGYASVQTGEYTALPHGSITPQVVREGTIILIDDGCTVEGYRSDITRTFVLGKATDKMNTVFDIVHSAQAAALAAARPGVPAENVDAAARKVIVDAGYGPDYKYFSHRLGHGIGMDGHEWPYLVRGNKQPLVPGNCFSDEPGIYIRGEFGVRIEDDMHITADGARLFTPPPPSLEDPFGNWPH